MTEETKAREPRSLRKLFFFGLLVIILLAGIAHFLWGVWAARHLASTLAELRAAGEPITMSELAIGTIPDADNASLNYRIAGESIDSSTPAWKKFDSSMMGAFRIPLTDEERATVRSIVAQNPQPLSQVTIARGKLAGDWNDPPANMLSRIGEDDFHLPRNVSFLLRLAAIDAHYSADDDRALQNLIDGVQEADAAEYRHSLVRHLVAVGASANVSEAISDLAPELFIGKRRLTRSRVTALISSLQRESEIDFGAKLALRTERIAAVDVIRDVAAGKTYLTMICGSNPPQWQASISGYLIKPLILGDARLYAKYIQAVIAAQSAPDWITAKEREPADVYEQAAAHPIVHFFLTTFSAQLEKAERLNYRVKTERRLATVALAGRLYAADHADHLPASLEELVPAYLPAVPIDAMSGKPLLFKSDPPRVYSVGDDGVDDGGVPVDPYAKDKFHRQHGDIVVYLKTQPRKSTK